MEVTAPALTKAEENCSLIQSLVKDIGCQFLELGGLLVDNQEKAYWGASGYESFKDFIEQLGVGYSWATRLMDLARIVAQQLLSKEEILEIGVSKACLLLPSMKRGALAEGVKFLARDCTWSDLRKELGHNIPEPKDCDEYMLCPRCGSDISPIRVKCRCGEEVTVKIGMIRRR